MFEVAKIQCYKNKLVFRKSVKIKTKLSSRSYLATAPTGYFRDLHCSGEERGAIHLNSLQLEMQTPSNLYHSFPNDKSRNTGNMGNSWPEGSPNFVRSHGSIFNLGVLC